MNQNRFAQTCHQWHAARDEYKSTTQPLQKCSPSKPHPPFTRNSVTATHAVPGKNSEASSHMSSALSSSSMLSPSAWACVCTLPRETPPVLVAVEQEEEGRGKVFLCLRLLRRLARLFPSLQKAVCMCMYICPWAESKKSYYVCQVICYPHNNERTKIIGNISSVFQYKQQRDSFFSHQTIAAQSSNAGGTFKVSAVRVFELFYPKKHSASNLWSYTTSFVLRNITTRTSRQTKVCVRIFSQ